MTKSIQFWDKIARRSKPDTPPETPNDTITRSAKYFTADTVALDMGCGLGGNTCDVAARVKQVDAFDYSAESIAVAKRQAENRGLTNIRFTLGDLLQISEQGKRYDIVLAYNILHLVDDHRVALAHIASLLKPNGLLISVTGCLREKTSVLRLLLRSLSKIGVVPPMHAFSIAQLESAVQTAHFEIVETAVLDHALSDYFLVARKPPAVTAANTLANN